MMWRLQALLFKYAPAVLDFWQRFSFLEWFTLILFFMMVWP
jgi:hypothetical protein